VPGLSPEPAQRLLVRREPGVQQLDGDRPVEHLVAGAPHLAERARADPLGQQVTIVKDTAGSWHNRALPEAGPAMHAGAPSLADTAP
jgi:hypothetical protein